MKRLSFFAFFLLCLLGCKMTTPIDGTNNRTYSSLTEYFQNIPGVQVTGSDNNGHIRLTGIGTTTTQVTDTSPLFVVDGIQVGRSLSGLASILNPNDIARVKVLRRADQTAEYGINGGSGVIEISTKK